MIVPRGVRGLALLGSVTSKLPANLFFTIVQTGHISGRLSVFSYYCKFSIAGIASDRIPLEACV